VFWIKILDHSVIYAQYSIAVCLAVRSAPSAGCHFTLRKISHGNGYNATEATQRHTQSSTVCIGWQNEYQLE